MYLSRLEIQGFKSFANSVSLDFRRGITAIVGPNGSGKSNVSDAIRWVLGEQSLKILRGKKSEDVIFAGSAKKTRLGMAEATLILDNNDHSAPIEYGEVAITRRVYRDGTGEYLINRQPARLQDILLLLAQANFGQRTYSVIGQGMIESLILSGPQERKHLFDEAAGVRQFQLKKDQAIQKLDQSKANMAQGEAIMAEIEPRLRSLTRQVRRLERRDEIEKELRDKQTMYFALRWAEIDREGGAIHAEWSTADAARAAIEKELTGTQHELEGIERERSASEIFSGLQKTYNGIIDEKNTLLQDQAAIKGHLETAAKQAGQADSVFRQQRIDEVQRSLNTHHEDIELITATITRAQAHVKQEQTTLQGVVGSFDKVQAEILALTSAAAKRHGLPEFRQAIHGWRDKYRQFVDTVLDAEVHQLPDIKTAARTLDSELATITEKFSESHEDVATELAALQQRIIALSADRQRAGEQVATAQHELHRAEDQRQHLEQAQAKLQAEYDKLKRDTSVQELAKTNPEAAYAQYVQEAKRIEKQLAEVDERLKQARQEINDFNQQETTKKERLFRLQKEFRDTQHRLNTATNAVNELQVQLARIDQRREDLKHEIVQAMTDAALEAILAASKKDLDGDVAMLAEDIGHLQHQIQLIGGIDEQVTHEYQETNERWEFLEKQSTDLNAAITSLEKAIAELDGIIKERFDIAFKKINAEFNTYFRTLFRGGRAELVLIKEVIAPEAPELTEAEAAQADMEKTAQPETPTTPKNGEKIVTGIDIKATPPGKKLQSIAMLSGGERALTSIALLCAIIANNPSPFIVLDEVDAALDEANSQRFAAIIDQLAGKTQFITISHNRATMEKAAVMYGVTMGDDGVSQLLSVKMDEAEELIRKHGNR